MPHGRTADTILFSKLNTPLDPLLLQGGLIEDLWCCYYYECSVHETVFLILTLLLLLSLSSQLGCTPHS